MKKVYGKCRQILSILLAVALTLTCVPQTGMRVFAAPESDMTLVEDAQLQEGEEQAGEEQEDGQDEKQDEKQDEEQDEKQEEIKEDEESKEGQEDDGLSDSDETDESTGEEESSVEETPADETDGGTEEEEKVSEEELITLDADGEEVPVATHTLTIKKDADQISKIEYAHGDSVPADTDFTEWTDMTSPADIPEDQTVYLKVTSDEGFDVKIIKQYEGGEETEADDSDYLENRGCYQFFMSENLTLTVSAETAKYAVKIKKYLDENYKSVESSAPFESVNYIITKQTDGGEEKVAEGGISSTNINLEVGSDEKLTLLVNTKERYDCRVLMHWKGIGGMTGENGETIDISRTIWSEGFEKPYKYIIKGANIQNNTSIGILAKELYTFTIRLDETTGKHIKNVTDAGTFRDFAVDVGKTESWSEPEEWLSEDDPVTEKEYQTHKYGYDRCDFGYFFYAEPEDGYDVVVEPSDPENIKSEIKDGKYCFKIRVTGDKTYTISAVPKPQCTLTIPDISTIKGIESVQYATELKGDPESSGTYVPDWKNFTDSTYPFVPRGGKIYLKVNVANGYDAVETKIYTTYGEAAEDKDPVTAEADGTYVLEMKDGLSLRIVAGLKQSAITVTKDANVKNVYYTIDNGAVQKVPDSGEIEATCENTVTLEFEMADNCGVTVTKTPNGGSPELETTYNTYTGRYECELKDITADVTVAAASVPLATIHMPKTLTGVSKVQYATRTTGDTAALTWHNAAAGETIQVPASGTDIYLLVTSDTGRKCTVSYGTSADDASPIPINDTVSNKNYYSLNNAVTSASDKKIWLFIGQDASAATQKLTISREGTTAAIRDIEYTLNADDGESWVSVGSAKEIQKLPKDAAVYVRVSVKPGYEATLTQTAPGPETSLTPDGDEIYSITMNADAAIRVEAAAKAQTVTYSKDLGSSADDDVFLTKLAFTRTNKDGKTDSLLDYVVGDVVTPTEPAKAITCEDTLTLSFIPKEGYKVTVTKAVGEAPAAGGDDTRKKTEQTYFPGQRCTYVIKNITASTEITVKAEKIASFSVEAADHIAEIRYAVGEPDVGAATPGGDTIEALPEGLTWNTAENKDTVTIENVGESENVYLLVLPEEHYEVTASQETDDPDTPNPLTGKTYQEKTASAEKIWLYYEVTDKENVTLKAEPKTYQVTVKKEVDPSEQGIAADAVFKGDVTYKKDGEAASITPDTSAPDASGDTFDFTYGETLLLEFSLNDSYTPVVTKTIGDKEQTLSWKEVSEDTANVGSRKYSYRVTGFTGNTAITITAKRANYKVNGFVRPKAGSGLTSADIEGVALKWGVSVSAGEGGESISAGSGLTFTVEGVDAGQRLDVTYRKKCESMPSGAGASDPEAELIRKETVKSGSKSTDTYTYRIDSADIKKTGDLTVLVEVRKKDGMATVKTADNEHVSKVYGEKDGKYTLEVTTAGVEQEEDAVFSFQITPETYYKVSSVKVNGENKVTVSGTGQNTVYSFVVEKGENTIHIETEQDPAQMYQLGLNLAGDPESVEITLAPAGPDADSSMKDTGMSEKFPEDGKNLATLNSAVLVTITPKDKYELMTSADGKALVSVSGAEGAKLTEETPPGDTSGARKYRITLVSKKTVVLTVKTKAKALADEATVTFELDEKQTTHVSGLRVDSQENRKGESMVVRGKNGVYTLKAGVERLKFTLDTAGPYRPLVTCNGISFDPDGKPVRNDDGTKTWQYGIAAGRLDRNALLVITEEEVKRDLTLSYDENESIVKVKNGNVPITPVDRDGAHYFENILEGTTLTVTVKAKEGFGITNITTCREGDDEEPVTEDMENAGSHRFMVDLSENTTVEIDTGEIVWGEKMEEIGGDEKTPNVVGEYSVNWDKKYTVSATIGKNTPVAFTGAELWQEQEEIPQGDDEDALWRCTISGKESSTRPQISFSDQLDKGKYRLVLFRKDKREDVPALTLYLNLYQPVRDDKVKIGAGGDIVQAADTTAYYTVTANAGASADSIFVAVKGKDPNTENKLPGDFDFSNNEDESVIIKKPVIRDGELEITTGRITGDSCWLMFYTQKPGTTAVNGVVDEEDRQYLTKRSGLTSKYLTVKVTAGHLFKENVVPTVKLKSASDVDLTFTVGAKNIGRPNHTKVYYEVIVSPQYENRHEGIIKKSIEPVYEEKDGDSQDVTIPVAVDGIEKGSGTDCKFDVRVRLVHANLSGAKKPEGANLEQTGNNAGTIKEENVLAAGTAFSRVGFAATRLPAYETKLTLKAVRSTLYTNQTAVVAEPKFSKITSYNTLEDGTQRDITPGLTDGEKLDISLDGNKIVAKAGAGAALGRHTIEVYAVTGDQEMYAARGEITVTVARGVEDITVNIPSDQICKTANKAATLKAVAAYNQVLRNADADTPAPKTPKVKWFVVGADTEEENVKGALPALRDLAKEKTFKNGIVTIDKGDVKEASDGLIKISQSGVVTVDKNCRTGVRFKVLALANDYEDSVVYGLSSPIAITDEPVVLDEVRIMKEMPGAMGENAGYREIRGDKTGTIEAGDLNGAFLMGFLSGMKEKDFYDEAAIGQYQVRQKLTYYSSNTKSVKVDTYSGKITVVSPAKNVKLYARTGDGRGTERSVTVTVCYDSTGELSLDITKQVKNGEKKIEWNAEESNSVGPAYSTVIPFKDSTAAVFDLQVQEKTVEKDWKLIPAYTNYSLSVSGGKLIEWNKKTGEAQVLVNTGQAVVKLTNNETKPKITKKFLLTNEALAAIKNVKAPKVSYTYANKNVIGAENGIRSVGIVLKDNGKNYPLNLYTGRTVTEGEELYAKIELDRAGQKSSNKEALDRFAESLQNRSLEQLTNTNSNIELRFDHEPLKAGNYKLKITVGTVDEERVFMPKAASSIVTIKVKKEPKLSFKPTATYKLSALDCTEVELKGRKAGKEMKVDFTGLKNAAKNSSKGEMNAFQTYFSLEGNKLRMTDRCFKEDKNGEVTIVIPEDDLVGYVEYVGYYDRTPEDSKLRGTARITIKLVDGKVASYTAKSTRADVKAYSVANVSILRDKQAVSIRYAAVEDADVGNWTVGQYDELGEWEDKAQITAWKPVVIQNQRKIDDKKIKAAKVTLRVIPEGSHYAAKAGLITDAEEQSAFVKKYGVQVRVSVPLFEFNTTTGRIEFDKKYKSLNYQKQGAYDAVKGVYYVDVPFRGVYANIADKLKNAKVDDTNQFYKNGITAEVVEGSSMTDSNSGVLRISVRKDALVKEPGPKDKKWYYTLKGKAPAQWKKPGTFPVKIAVTYGGSEKDEFVFNLTMPNYPAYVTQEADDDDTRSYTDFEQVMEYVRENADAFGAAAARLVERDDYGRIEEIKDPDDRREEIERAVKEKFEIVLRNGGYSDAYGSVSGVSYDCGIDFDSLVEEVGDGEDEYKAPTAVASGGVNLEVKFTNGAENEAPRSQRVNFTVRLKPLKAVQVTDIAGHVDNFLKTYNKDGKVWDVNEKEVRKSLYAYLGEQGLDEAYISNYRFQITVVDVVSETEDTDTPNDNNESAKKKVTIVIQNVTHTEEDWKTKTVIKDDVPAGEKQTPAGAVAAVKEALGIEPEDKGKIKKLAASNTQRGVEKAILAAARGAIDLRLYEIDFVEKEGKPDITFEPVSQQSVGGLKDGSLSYSLKLTKKVGEEISAADDPYKGIISFNDKIEVRDGQELLEVQQAAARVEQWIADNTLTAAEDAGKSTKVLKGDTSAERILNAIRKTAVPEDSGVLVGFQTKRNAAGGLISDIKVKEATVNAEGSVRGVLRLSKEDEDGKETVELVEIDVVIPELSQNAQEAADAIESALNREGVVTIPAGVQDGDEAVTQMIIDRAKAVKKLKKDAFHIEVADGGELTITPAEKAKEGTAEITLHVWKIGSGYSSGADAEIVIPISKAEN